MKHATSIGILIAALVWGVGCSGPGTPRDSYDLTVTLNTPYNTNFTIRSVVVLDQPFELTKANGEIRNTVSGVLKEPVDGRYPLELTVSEWESEQSNIKDTADLTLELDKAWSGGPVSSFVYLRTVTLSQKEP